jgi:hypothetical protein
LALITGQVDVICACEVFVLIYKGYIMGQSIWAATILEQARETAWKTSRLAQIAVSNPLEFVDRIRAIVEVQSDRLFSKTPSLTAIPFNDLLSLFKECWGAATSGCPNSSPLIKSQTTVTDTGVRKTHDADLHLADLLYVCCKVLKPSIVVETGVGNGVTSAYILAALCENQNGILHSIDLPPLSRPGHVTTVGKLIPQKLRSRWVLHRGTSRRALASVLSSTGGIDIFCHDSLHTRSTMYYEFHTAFKYLRRPGVLISDDVDLNHTFANFIEATTPSFAACSRGTKKNAFGICLYK